MKMNLIISWDTFQSLIKDLRECRRYPQGKEVYKQFRRDLKEICTCQEDYKDALAFINGKKKYVDTMVTDAILQAIYRRLRA